MATDQNSASMVFSSSIFTLIASYYKTWHQILAKRFFPKIPSEYSREFATKIDIKSIHRISVITSLFLLSQIIMLSVYAWIGNGESEQHFGIFYARMFQLRIFNISYSVAFLGLYLFLRISGRMQIGRWWQPFLRLTIYTLYGISIVAYASLKQLHTGDISFYVFTLMAICTVAYLTRSECNILIPSIIVAFAIAMFRFQTDSALRLSNLLNGVVMSVFGWFLAHSVLAYRVRDFLSTKKAQQASLKTKKLIERKYRSIVDRSSDGILLIQNGIVKYANKKMLSLWGGTLEEATNTPFAKYVHAGSIERTLHVHRQRMEGKNAPGHYEAICLRKNGAPFHVEISGESVRHADMPASLVILRDITDRKKNEAALKSASLESIYMLTRAAEYRDEDTAQHILRISYYSAALAKKLGLDEQTTESLLHASPMHDIGKIGVPDNVLLKPGKLTDEEWEIMREHTLAGEAILANSQFPHVKMGQIVAGTHHEKWDGTGYPRGLKGEEIPLVGRIVALVDVFDALTSTRPYKKAMPNKQALDIISSSSGTHFDPSIVEAFFEILPEIYTLQQKYCDVHLESKNPADTKRVASVEELATP